MVEFLYVCFRSWLKCRVYVSATCASKTAALVTLDRVQRPTTLEHFGPPPLRENHNLLPARSKLYG